MMCRTQGLKKHPQMGTTIMMWYVLLPVRGEGEGVRYLPSVKGTLSAKSRMILT